MDAHSLQEIGQPKGGKLLQSYMEMERSYIGTTGGILLFCNITFGEMVNIRQPNLLRSSKTGSTSSVMNLTPSSTPSWGQVPPSASPKACAAKPLALRLRRSIARLQQRG